MLHNIWKEFNDQHIILADYKKGVEPNNEAWKSARVALIELFIISTQNVFNIFLTSLCKKIDVSKFHQISGSNWTNFECRFISMIVCTSVYQSIVAEQFLDNTPLEEAHSRFISNLNLKNFDLNKQIFVEICRVICRDVTRKGIEHSNRNFLGKYMERVLLYIIFWGTSVFRWLDDNQPIYKHPARFQNNFYNLFQR